MKNAQTMIRLGSAAVALSLMVSLALADPASDQDSGAVQHLLLSPEASVLTNTHPFPDSKENGERDTLAQRASELAKKSTVSLDEDSAKVVGAAISILVTGRLLVLNDEAHKDAAQKNELLKAQSEDDKLLEYSGNKSVEEIVKNTNNPDLLIKGMVGTLFQSAASLYEINQIKKPLIPEFQDQKEALELQYAANIEVLRAVGKKAIPHLNSARDDAKAKGLDGVATDLDQVSKYLQSPEYDAYIKARDEALAKHPAVPKNESEFEQEFLKSLEKPEGGDSIIPGTAPNGVKKTQFEQQKNSPSTDSAEACSLNGTGKACKDS